MTGDAGDPMAAEFDTVAEWTAQVAADLGPQYLVPAACRGSGPPALDWLLAGLRPEPGDLMVDAGAGTSTDLSSLLRRAHLDVLGVADSLQMPEPPAGWLDRTAAVERELQRRFGSTPQLSAATEQSDRIGALLGSGQLTSQAIMLRRE